MKINVREDHVEIEGYVNAIERNSKPLSSRLGHFVERICKGAFKRALKRNNDVHILLNHDWKRDLGSTKKGNLQLEEDNIGLRAEVTITEDKIFFDKSKNYYLSSLLIYINKKNDRAVAYFSVTVFLLRS